MPRTIVLSWPNASQHKVSLRLSEKRYRAAIFAWHGVRVQREQAVHMIVLALPLVLTSSAFYVIGAEEVRPANWVSSGLLVIGALYVLYTIFVIEEEFQAAEAEDKDLHSLLHWRVVSRRVALRSSLCGACTEAAAARVFRCLDLHMHRS